MSLFKNVLKKQEVINDLQAELTIQDYYRIEKEMKKEEKNIKKLINLLAEANKRKLELSAKLSNKVILVLRVKF